MFAIGCDGCRASRQCTVGPTFGKTLKHRIWTRQLHESLSPAPVIPCFEEATSVLEDTRRTVSLTLNFFPIYVGPPSYLAHVSTTTFIDEIHLAASRCTNLLPCDETLTQRRTVIPSNNHNLLYFTLYNGGMITFHQTVNVARTDESPRISLSSQNRQRVEAV